MEQKWLPYCLPYHVFYAVLLLNGSTLLSRHQLHSVLLVSGVGVLERPGLLLHGVGDQAPVRLHVRRGELQDPDADLGNGE